MKLIDYINSEIKFFNRTEKIFYTVIILIILSISILMNDSKIALISSICGITYTLLAGKGKVYCYYIGILGTLFYCIIAFQNGLYANTALYGLYFLPMQILGIFKWKKHINKEKNEIIKTNLNMKQKVNYVFASLILSGIIYMILLYTKGSAPVMDSIAASFSILGQYLTVKRCIEQWYVWFIVNLVTLIMWIIAYYNGSNCLATIIMWLIYLFLSVYFLIKWDKEMQSEK